MERKRRRQREREKEREVEREKEREVEREGRGLRGRGERSSIIYPDNDFGSHDCDSLLIPLMTKLVYAVH